jgi:CRP-like cAMP-binding protein
MTAAGVPHRLIQVRAGHVFFSQGTQSDWILFESGRAKVTVVSQRRKEATVTLLIPGDFIGEESLAGEPEIHDATPGVTACKVVKLTRKEMISLLHEHHEFSDIFLKFVLLRGVKAREDLVDQLFSNSEMRLARTLLIMAEFGKPGEPETMIPPITQEELDDIVGTAPSRVSKFMNNVLKLQYIDYNGSGRIHIYKTLLNAVLHDGLPGQTARRPVAVDHQLTTAREPKRTKVV